MILGRAIAKVQTKKKVITKNQKNLANINRSVKKSKVTAVVAAATAAVTIPATKKLSSAKNRRNIRKVNVITGMK